MPDWLSEAWHTPGLGWLALLILVAGVVRGFAGFGSGLIFVPLAATFLPPVWVITALMPAEFLGAVPLLRRAARDGSRPDVAALLLGAALCLPVGVVLLQQLDPEIFRWMAGTISLCMVAILLSGWRHHFQFERRALVGIGGLSGFMGGSSGMPGPPVILAYMSGQYPPERIRANALLFLLANEALLAVVFIAQGILEPHALILGLLLAFPYLLGNVIGGRIFDPGHARLYRGVAYGIIAASALLALPLFG